MSETGPRRRRKSRSETVPRNELPRRSAPLPSHPHGAQMKVTAAPLGGRHDFGTFARSPLIPRSSELACVLIPSRFISELGVGSARRFDGGRNRSALEDLPVREERRGPAAARASPPTRLVDQR